MQQTKRGGSGALVSMEQQGDDAAEPSALMQTYQQRYEALHQERLRSRRQRASEQFVSTSASAAGLDVERMSEGFHHAVGNRYDDSATPQYAVNDREEETHVQQNQQWSYTEHGDNRDDESREDHDEDDDMFDLPPVDQFAREQQHYQQYDPFQSALSEQQAFVSGVQQGVSLASEEFVDAGAFLTRKCCGYFAYFFCCG